MAKFCTKCGRELTVGAKFCPGCGAPIPGGTVNPEPVPPQGGMPAYGGMQGASGGMYAPMGAPAGAPAAKAKSKIPVVAAGAAVIILVLFVIVRLMSGGGYKKPIENLERGLNKQDVKLISSAFASGEIPDSEILDIFEGLGGFVDYKVEIDIIGEQKIPKQDIEYVLSEEYDVDEVYAKSASAAYALDLNMSISMGDYSDSDTETIPVAKINGKWVIPADLYDLF